MSKKDSVRFIEECYSLYEQKMYRVAFAILKDPTSAEDAVQEAFLKLMKSKKTFEDVRSDDCKRYLIQVIKSAAINIYRTRQKDSQVLSSLDQEQFSNNLYSEDEEIDVKAVVDKLPSKYKDVVKCLVIDNLSVRETSLALDITESSVRKRFERAKKKVKAYVQRTNQ